MKNTTVTIKSSGKRNVTQVLTAKVGDSFAASPAQCKRNRKNIISDNEFSTAIVRVTEQFKYQDCFNNRVLTGGI